MLRASTCSRLAAGLLGATLLVAAPPPSLADDDHRYGYRGGWDDEDSDSDDDGRRRHHRRHRHGDWCPPSHFGRGPGVYWGGYRDDDWRWRQAYSRPRYVQHRYFCAPCDHWWHDRAGFHRHVRRHHHVPEYALADVIARAVFGSVFLGY
jgi:hypothetical protein